MNILFVMYGDFTSNSANLLVLYTRELHKMGHHCAVAVPYNTESIIQHGPVHFQAFLYEQVLSNPVAIFDNKQPADVMHAWTPREIVREFVVAYMTQIPTPLVIFQEDNEAWLAQQVLGNSAREISRLTGNEISQKLSNGFSHPFHLDAFLGLADAVITIQDKLKTTVPPWVYTNTVMVGIDTNFFTPRPPDASLKRTYHIADNEKIIVFHGGINGFTKPGIKSLCEAIGLINQSGYPCRLLRSGPYPLDFLDQLSPEVTQFISDLGILPKSELPRLLSLADIFVQPGKVDPFEDLRLPCKVPEFLAMGRPLLMPKANIEYLLTNNKNVIFLEYGTAEEISNQCIALFNDPHKANSIGKASRLAAEKYFDVRVQAPILEKVYDKARARYYPAYAQMWQDPKMHSNFPIMLANKLRHLCEKTSDNKFDFDCNVSEILEQFSGYIEKTEERAYEMQERIQPMQDRIQSIKKRNQKLLKVIKRSNYFKLKRYFGKLQYKISKLFNSHSRRKVERKYKSCES